MTADKPEALAVKVVCWEIPYCGDEKIIECRVIQQTPSTVEGEDGHSRSVDNG